MVISLDEAIAVIQERLSGLDIVEPGSVIVKCNGVHLEISAVMRDRESSFLAFRARLEDEARAAVRERCCDV